MSDLLPGHHAWISMLETVNAGQNAERLEALAKQALAEDPEFPAYHYYLAQALIDQDRSPEAKRSYEILRSAEPASSRQFWIALQIAHQAGSARSLRATAREALAHFPDESGFYYYAAVAETRRFRTKKALELIRHARSMDPDDTDYLALESRLTGAVTRSGKKAWERVADLERGLSSDPESAELHNALGDLFADELEDAARAESCYLEAVRLEPENRIYQRDLFSAIGRRRILYRVLSLPGAGFRMIAGGLELIRHRPLYLLLGLLCAKFVGAFLAWLLITTPLFYPGAKFYEWLVTCQLRDAGSIGGVGGWFFRKVQPMPKLVRYVLFAGLSAGTWAFVFWAIKVPLSRGFETAFWIFVAHYVIVGSLVWYRRVRSWIGKKRAAGNR